MMPTSDLHQKVIGDWKSLGTQAISMQKASSLRFNTQIMPRRCFITRSCPFRVHVERAYGRMKVFKRLEIWTNNLLIMGYYFIHCFLCIISTWRLGHYSPPELARCYGRSFNKSLYLLTIRFLIIVSNTNGEVWCQLGGGGCNNSLFCSFSDPRPVSY